MTKRPSLFGDKSTAPAERPAEARAEPAPAPASREAVTTQRYPKASTREGKRVVTAYLDPEAFRQLKRIAADEDAQQQDLLLEGINLVFEKRGLSRIA
ncbi:ribbon-helix-helix domain-containing protein [Methylobacterium sp. E-045]|uniref:ribbon-helix-helix domain-containing protein n=1 Tax=Methylobacterium sp. E-045 TaxID=2836575 RepID=UPI001FBBBCC2|nr:ribbon-helix-helix domain-containing protein [Methylobacterium sp. E-045]MCJ2131278.1 hypothetical protein [Methylobacterium sp. E-045]